MRQVMRELKPKFSKIPADSIKAVTFRCQPQTKTTITSAKRQSIRSMAQEGQRRVAAKQVTQNAPSGSLPQASLNANQAVAWQNTSQN